MDKSLNSSPRLPWWLVLLQISPLVLQLLGEIVLRVQGVPLIVETPQPLHISPSTQNLDFNIKADAPISDASIPGPIEV